MRKTLARADRIEASPLFPLANCITDEIDNLELLKKLINSPEMGLKLKQAAPPQENKSNRGNTRNR